MGEDLWNGNVRRSPEGGMRKHPQFGIQESPEGEMRTHLQFGIPGKPHSWTVPSLRKLQLLPQADPSFLQDSPGQVPSPSKIPTSFSQSLLEFIFPEV